MSTIGYYICVPFAWILRTFYELTGSYGWALVLFTLVVKLITLPFQMKSKKSMMRMNLFQPKMKEIQTKYANNPQRMNEEMQLLYTQEGVNPMSGCLWSFLPFPILIALYSIIRQPLSRFMLLSKDVVTEITSLATTLGYNAESVRVQVDAENYREKREQSLERLAEKVAGKVTKYRRNVTLEPMNAYERHVIHTALQDTPGVTTFSIGTEPNRRVVVSYDRTKA